MYGQIGSVFAWEKLVDLPAWVAPSLKHLLLKQLQESIDLAREQLKIAQQAPCEQESIPLHQSKDWNCLQYRSAIALKLAASWQHPAIEIATQIATGLAAPQGTEGPRVFDFTIKVVAPGWIDFQLTDQGIASWLQRLSQGQQMGERASSSISIQPSSIFPIQYAHARCCSLLRLGHRQGVIVLSDPDTHFPVWNIIAPNPIPWLDSNQKLQLVHPAERRLIAQILEILDTRDKVTLKQATALSEAFENVYSHCRIFGEVSAQMPQLAQARLGLVMVTQALVRSLLQVQLGFPAPMEL